MVAGKAQARKERYDLSRALAKTLAREASASGWRCSQGVAFASRGDWFLALNPIVHIAAVRTQVMVLAKPMAVDPIFWAMAGEPQLAKGPLSYRFFGVLACTALKLAELDLAEDGGPEALASRVIDLGNATFADIEREHLGIEDFLTRLDREGFGANPFATRVAALAAAGRLDESLALCRGANGADIPGGFVGPRGRFATQALQWLQQRLESSTH